MNFSAEEEAASTSRNNMALIIRGKTKCPLCQKLITENDDVISFPAFLGVGHPLNRFSDSAFHRACFAKSPESIQVESLYRRYRKIWEERPKDLKSAEEIEAWGNEAFKDFK
jgi:hypothetical protein